MLLGALVVLLVPLSLIGPYVRDDLVLDRIVKVAALDWRDFGETTARQRLQYELDLRRIGTHVRDQDCVFTEQAQVRRVRCAWKVRVSLPGAEVELPLAFMSEAVVHPDGDVTP